MCMASPTVSGRSTHEPASSHGMAPAPPFDEPSRHGMRDASGRLLLKNLTLDELTEWCDAVLCLGLTYVWGSNRVLGLGFWVNPSPMFGAPTGLAEESGDCVWDIHTRLGGEELTERCERVT